MNQLGANPASGVTRCSVIETVVTVFVLGYGLHYFAYFLRARYFTWLGARTMDEGISHCFVVVLIGRRMRGKIEEQDE